MKQIRFNSEESFKKINHLPFNREYCIRQDLIESMQESGFIVPIILLKTDLIDGKEKLWILDGQHRCLTARFLGIEVVGEIIQPDNIKSIEDIVKLVASLNSNSKAWQLINYVEAYNFLNYPEYRELLRITHNSPYSVNTMATLLAGHTSIKNSNTKLTRSGKFKIVDKEGAIDAIEFATELSKYEKVTARMLVALKRTMGLKKFDKAYFKEQYKKHTSIIRDLKLDDYTNIFSSWVK